MPAVIDQLPADIESCHSMIRQLQALLQTQLQQHNNDVAILTEKVNYLLQARFGQKSERVNPDQLRLFTPPANETQIEAQEESTSSVAQHQHKGHGRKKRELPRIRQEYTLPQSELICKCCNKSLNKIGEEISEQLEYVPASLHIIEHVRFKYACLSCEENVVIAPKPQQPIEKGLPGPGLLAYVATSKYGDHLPLHRLEHILKRQGAEIRRSTMWDWMAATAGLLVPLCSLMKERLLKSTVIHTDDTVLPLLEKGRKKAREARIWVYLGDTDNPFALFDYTKSRERDGPKTFLGDYQGYLQADAFKGYDCIYANGSVIEVACWAHARRYFFDALKSAPQQADFAIKQIRELYKIERETKELSNEERQKIRQEQAVPILDAIEKWLNEQVLFVLPKSLIAKAVNYALNNWQALRQYTKDGQLNIDNNPAERAIRPVVIGRKNWLFVASDNGGRTAAILNSIVASCQRNKIDPQAYLANILPKLPNATTADLVAMLPNTWSPDSDC